MDDLARLMAEFRDRLGLTKVKAARVLGLARNTIASIESGKDVTTGLPFKPREATLRALAMAMNEYAISKGSTFRVTFEQLREAAGLASGDGAPPIVDAPSGTVPWTDEEARVLAEMLELGLRPPWLFDEAVRRLQPAARASRFERCREMIAKAREIERMNYEMLVAEGVIHPGNDPTGGGPPLTAEERRIVDELGALTGGDLDSISMGPTAEIWTRPGKKRLAALREALTLERESRGVDDHMRGAQ